VIGPGGKETPIFESQSFCQLDLGHQRVTVARQMENHDQVPLFSWVAIFFGRVLLKWQVIF
jgi:hypothetical protein